MTRQLPEEVIDAWNERKEPLVVTTVDRNGLPNSIYASIVHLASDGRIAVADNYFDKTAANITCGTSAVFLFITPGNKAYQIKGRLDYHKSGPLFDEMIGWADPQHPRRGVVLMNPEAVYRGSTRLL